MPKRIEMPGFIKPQLATLQTKAPKGDQWLYEIKYDGYRGQVHLKNGRKKVNARNGLDSAKRFTEIAGAIAIPGEAIIDGEVVVVHEGRTNFSELQAELAQARPSNRFHEPIRFPRNQNSSCTTSNIGRTAMS